MAGSLFTVQGGIKRGEFELVVVEGGKKLIDTVRRQFTFVAVVRYIAQGIGVEETQPHRCREACQEYAGPLSPGRQHTQSTRGSHPGQRHDQ